MLAAPQRSTRFKCPLDIATFLHEKTNSPSVSQKPHLAFGKSDEVRCGLPRRLTILPPAFFNCIFHQSQGIPGMAEADDGDDELNHDLLPAVTPT